MSKRGQAKPGASAITGVEAMMGKGVKEPLGFWADAWSQVIRRPGAVLGLSWVGIVAFFAIFSPLIANGHPVVMREIDVRRGADAAAAVRTDLGRLEVVSERDVRQAVRLELERHSPRLSVEEAVGGGALAFETTVVEVFDERGFSREIESVGGGDVDRVAEALAASAVLDETGGVARVSSPLLENLSAADIVILLGTLIGGVLLAVPGSASRGTRSLWILAGSVQAVVMIVGAGYVSSMLGSRQVADVLLRLQSLGIPENPAPDVWRPFVTVLVLALASATTFVLMFVPTARSGWTRLGVHVVAGVVAAVAIGWTWGQPPERFDYAERERLGQIEATYTLVPFSPTERLLDRNAAALPPGMTTDQALARRLTTGIPARGVIGDVGAAAMVTGAAGLPLDVTVRDGVVAALEGSLVALPADFAREVGADRAALNADPPAGFVPLDESPGTLAELRVDEAERLAIEVLSGEGRVYVLGSDATGQDVMSQMMHACRLSVSIGLVATGIAVVIGVTMGAIMGYFGGLVDLALYRVVEIFMAIPVLFLLIVAAAVLPRNTYFMMAIIGCFTWHSIARFTRAEFYKLRNQDFVQSAQAVGLPLWSVLFKHMLPNGVTPVLVDASFRIAVAILFETILSYLGLGPEDQASWGRLLSDATQSPSGFDWWLATFPGFAIFLTVLGYNLIGEALRDAIDPKLKKARV